MLMADTGPVKILFVINPGSGMKSKQEWENAINDYFRPLNFNIEFYILDNRHDEESIKHWLEKFGPDVAVAVGGDGTVSLVARMITGTGVALGILPAGSANGMAKELGIPLQAEAALDILAKGTSRQADVIRINDKEYCLHLSDIGLNAKLIRNFEAGRLRGKIGYASKVLKTLWTKSPMIVSISIDGHTSTHKALMVVLANARMYGTGAIINPLGDLYDGKFEVVIVHRLALSELFRMWFRPSIFDPKKIKIFPATAVSIRTSRRVHFQVDGEYLGKVSRVEASILAGQLKLIIP